MNNKPNYTEMLDKLNKEVGNEAYYHKNIDKINEEANKMDIKIDYEEMLDELNREWLPFLRGGFSKAAHLQIQKMIQDIGLLNVTLNPITKKYEFSDYFYRNRNK